MIAIPVRASNPSFCNTVAEKIASMGPETRIAIHEIESQSETQKCAYRYQSQDEVHDDLCIKYNASIRGFLDPGCLLTDDTTEGLLIGIFAYSAGPYYPRQYDS
jgi:hypothetical protein